MDSNKKSLEIIKNMSEEEHLFWLLSFTPELLPPITKEAFIEQLKEQKRKGN